MTAGMDLPWLIVPLLFAARMVADLLSSGRDQIRSLHGSPVPGARGKIKDKDDKAGQAEQKETGCDDDRLAAGLMPAGRAQEDDRSQGDAGESGGGEEWLDIKKCEARWVDCIHQLELTA